MDQIRLREARPDCPTKVTVLGGSMFFKDTDRVLKTMRRRGTASAFGDMFSRRYNPIHGADLAARWGCPINTPALHSRACILKARAVCALTLHEGCEGIKLLMKYPVWRPLGDAIAVRVERKAGLPVDPGLKSCAIPLLFYGRHRLRRHLIPSRLVDSLERPQDAGQVIPVGGPDVLTYRQIAVLAAGAAGVKRPR